MYSSASTHSARTPRALPVISSSFSALILAFLPKCPFCLVLLLAPLGIKVPGSGSYLVWAFLMLAAIPVAFFWSAPCHRGGVRPLLFGLTGLGILTAGRFIGSAIAGADIAIMAAGAALMVGAALWSSGLRTAGDV
jgi:hypothetical protein